MIVLWTATALATSGFGPKIPDATFTGAETFTQDGGTQLWSRIERYADPDRTLFVKEAFNDALTWTDADYAPWIATCFGSGTPHSSAFLLHAGPRADVAEGTPILFVPGAGDNGSRGFVTMATRMDNAYRPVFALTFAHPHGDVLRQAEIVADAIAVITARTGAAQVDVVAHSKGGAAVAAYLSHTPGADWGRPDYEAVATPYRGDVRRAVFIASPLGGIDTAYRWPNGNLFSLDADAALAPTSWSAYYPSGSAVFWDETDLIDQDFLASGADYFPGQRQLLARQTAPLPGTQTWLDGYALQLDWYTTYEGGLGFVSDSAGIDDAIAEGGDFLSRLAAQGVDPQVAIYLLAGSNPLMVNGDADLRDLWSGVASEADWRDLVESIDGHGVPLTPTDAEIAGLADGALVLGEVTGPSDGLVFVDSATRADALTARGATVVESRVVDLSHLDLLYASPITGQLLQDEAAADPDLAWLGAVGARYAAADTLGWVEGVLADDTAGDDPTADTGTPDPADDGPDAATTPTGTRPCGSCDATGLPFGPWPLALLAAWARRRR